MFLSSLLSLISKILIERAIFITFIIVATISKSEKTLEKFIDYIRKIETYFL